MTNVQTNIVQILRDHAVVDGTAVRLTCGQLDRKIYQAVNEVLERLGGKWNRKAAAHVFTGDPAPLLEEVIHTGAMPQKNPLAYFATPPQIAARMVEAARMEGDEQVLEPSAGEGAICDAVRSTHPQATIRAVEIDPCRAAMLHAKGYDVHEQDFLTFRSLMLFDTILMNPPFAVDTDPLAYITHIEHAFSLLAPWGRLVAIAPTGFTFRTDRRSAGFRAFVEQHGGWDDLPAKAFSASDTGVSTVMIVLSKSAARPAKDA